MLCPLHTVGLLKPKGPAQTTYRFSAFTVFAHTGSDQLLLSSQSIIAGNIFLSMTGMRLPVFRCFLLNYQF
jgi:hypothetical protein